MIKINDGSKDKIYSSNIELIDNFTDYSSKNLDFDKPVEIDFLDNEDNAKNPLGTTAHYNPDEMKITIYVTGRHLKDILRSISHELIHHVQNCRGDFNGMEDTGLGYAQKDKHMRGMEQEAYTAGNIMNFRDFEDTYKKENRQMKTTLKELKKIINEELDDLKEQSQTTRSGEYRGVEYTGSPRQDALSKVSMSGYVVKAIAECRRPRRVAAYIKAQAGSNYVNNSELLLLTLGVESCDKKGKVGDIISSLGMRTKEDLYTYLTSGSTKIRMSSPTTEKYRKRLRNVLAPPSRGGMSLAGPGGRSGVPQDGVVGQTMAKRATASPAGRIKYKTCRKLPLRLGCKGDMVMVLQSLLYNALKLKTSRKKFIDSQYGPGTKKAVEAFQRKAKLGVDGVAGKNTFDALKKTQPKKAVAGLDKRVDDATASDAGPASASPKAKSPSASPIPKRFTAQQIGTVLKNVNKVVSPEGPKAKAIIKKLMRAQDKGELLDLKKIKLVADTMLLPDDAKPISN